MHEQLAAARLVVKVLAWGWLGCIVLLSIVPAALRPDTNVDHGLEHFGAFFVAGLLFAIGYWRRTTVNVLFALSFPAAIEVAQIFVPGRHARVSDFIVDSAGALLAVAIVQLPGRLRLTQVERR